jgi:hypothetical protein
MGVKCNLHSSCSSWQVGVLGWCCLKLCCSLSVVPICPGQAIGCPTLTILLLLLLLLLLLPPSATKCTPCPQLSQP